MSAFSHFSKHIWAGMCYTQIFPLLTENPLSYDPPLSLSMWPTVPHHHVDVWCWTVTSYYWMSSHSLFWEASVTQHSRCLVSQGTRRVCIWSRLNWQTQNRLSVLCFVCSAYCKAIKEVLKRFLHTVAAMAQMSNMICQERQRELCYWSQLEANGGVCWRFIFRHPRGRAPGRVRPFDWSVGPPLWFKLKYLNNCWTDCHEIWYTHLCPPPLIPFVMPWHSHQPQLYCCSHVKLAQPQSH